MSLRVWLPLNGNLENKGLDDVAITNNGAVVDNNGKIGKCYSFDGSNDKLILTSNKIYETAIGSIACWIKLNALPSSSGFYALGQIGALSGYAGCRLGLYFEYSNKINVSINGSSTGSNIYVHSLQANEWYHLCATYDGTLVKLYLNGNEVMSKTASVSSYKTNTSNIYVGGTSSYYFNGEMNDFRIYDHALSPMEVKQISQGLVLHYPLNHGGLGQENLLKDSQIEHNHIYNSSTILHYYFNATGNLPTGTYTFSFDIKSDNGTDKCYASYAKGNSTIHEICKLANIPLNWTHYTYTFINDSTECNNVFIAHYTGHGKPYNNNNIGTIYVKNVKLELGTKPTPWSPAPSDDLYSIIGGDNTVEYDCSGYNNNGTKIGTLDYSSDTPRYDVSTVFNNSPIKINDFIFTTDIWTISFWYYLEEAPAGYQCFICLSRGNGADSNKKIAACPNTSYIWFKFESASFTVHSLKIQEWTHIVMTCDSTYGKVYENGILKSTSPAISSTLTDCNDLVVGARSNATDITSTAVPFTGSMSDVRIYATALSPEDVLDLYNLGAAIDTNNNLYTYEVTE